MIASRRAAEITYYDELGVTPGASPEEIRDAFRSLVRLLHPDQQTDSQLKEIAEKQMRKLNRIYSVLSDPDRRRSYDDDLDDDYGPAIQEEPRPGLSKMMARAAWATAIVISTILLIWLASDSAPSPQSRVHDEVAEAPANSVSASKPSTRREEASLIASLRSDLKAVTLERDAAIHELTRLRGRKEPSAQTTSSTRADGTDNRPPAITMTELPSAPRLPIFANTALPRMENPANRKLSGFWFYAKPPLGQRNKDQALYPPQYIELTIREESGVVYGRYRARFEVADRPISPDVNFTFTGPAGNGAQPGFQWTGAGGAKGDLTLKFVSQNSMKIDWNATEMGTQLGLDNGTAVLTRRIE